MNEKVLRSMIKEPSVSAVVLQETASTNDLLKSLANEGAPEGTLVLAEEQTAGRGRMGRSFYSPQGTGLYMSLLLRPEIYLKEALIITAMAAVAGAEAIDELRKGKMPKCRIKWVNDLYLDGKKTAGILAEGALSSREPGKASYVVLGIGFNITCPEQGFPGDLGQIAGGVLSAEEAREDMYARERLAAAFIDRFYVYYRSFCRKHDLGFMDRYRERSNLIGKTVILLDSADHQPLPGDNEVTVEAIDDEARLIVRKHDGTLQEIFSGEVSLKYQ